MYLFRTFTFNEFTLKLLYVTLCSIKKKRENRVFSEQVLLLEINKKVFYHFNKNKDHDW